MDVEIQVDLVKNAGLRFPQLETSGPVTRHWDELGYRITTGIGDDLMQAARDAWNDRLDMQGNPDERG